MFLLHGRGADEKDLFPLCDMLDPARRLVGVTPRGPLSLPPGGAHWYVIRELGYPDPATFNDTLGGLREWTGNVCDHYGVAWQDCVVGGFSQGAVMSYALSCQQGYPLPRALIAFSGFVPTADGFVLKEDLSGLPVAIGHGTFDNVINVEWSQRARDLLVSLGADVIYREYNLTHTIDPGWLEDVRRWLEPILGPPGGTKGA